MRTSSPERRRVHPAVVVLCGALVGAMGGLALPRTGLTSAELTSQAAVTAVVSVPACGGLWSEHVVGLTPAVHWSFDGVDSPAGDVPAPGLLVCDPSGALTLHGGVDEGLVGTVLADGSTATVALKVRPADAGGSGELVLLVQPDGHGLAARLSPAGSVELVEQPAGGGTPVVLGTSSVTPGDTVLVTVTRSGGLAVLWLDGTAAVIATLAEDPVGAATVTLGAPAGSGLTAASAVVDELIVLQNALTGTDIAALVAADRW